MRLHDHLDYRALLQPDGELAVLGKQRITYAEGAAHVERLAGAMAERGLPSGARVAYLSKNAPEFCLFYFAGSKAGVVPVPLNYRLAPPEWEYILNDSGAELVVAQGVFAEGIDEVRDRLTSVKHFVVADGERDGWESLADWLQSDPITSELSLERACDDVYQMYTSGTTGRPKGAVVSQAAVLTVLLQWRITYPLSSGERVLMVAPIYHVGGALFTCHAVSSGGSLYVMTDFEPVATVRAMDEERIGFGFLVPAMIQACLTQAPDVAERRYEQLRIMAYGASPIAEATLRHAMDVFGCEFIQAFGMTEAPNLTYLTQADHARALGGRPELLLSTGRSGPGSAIKIVDENDREVPAGTVGEICGLGGQVMSHYWNLPEATDAALRGGWMHTGDAGYVDEEGYLYIKDRLKDMISSGAENIYPREVEDVLFAHPAVADAAVIGVPSERWGETVKAIVVLKPGETVSEQELMDFCQARIAGYKRPRSVDFIDELPRNPSGKVLKRELREPYWEGHDRRVG